MWNRMGSMLEEVVNECMSFVLLRDEAFLILFRKHQNCDFVNEALNSMML